MLSLPFNFVPIIVVCTIKLQDESCGRVDKSGRCNGDVCYKAVAYASGRDHPLKRDILERNCFLSRKAMNHLLKRSTNAGGSFKPIFFSATQLKCFGLVDFG
uniref:Uncharacterized protein n=1 Tax=Romanomermis culicivorax TaxID=13658 RepID=A0A915HRG3_ROMCU